MMRKEYYTTLTEKMVGSTKQQWYQSFLSKQYSKKCMIILAILVLERFTHYKRYYFWPKMIKHIQKHVDICSLCRRDKMQADKYQLQTTEIPKRAFG